MTDKEIYQSAIDTFGQESQVDKFIEESAETIQALLKLRRVTIKTADDNFSVWSEDFETAWQHLHEEFADLEIVFEQMKLIFDTHKINVHKQCQLMRLQRLINEHQQNVPTLPKD